MDPMHGKKVSAVCKTPHTRLGFSGTYDRRGCSLRCSDCERAPEEARIVYRRPMARRNSRSLSKTSARRRLNSSLGTTESPDSISLQPIFNLIFAISVFPDTREYLWLVGDVERVSVGL